MVQTFKEFTFEAAHALPPFSPLHGHTFRVEVALSGEPDPVYGWSHNLFDVEAAVEAVRGDLDHKYLNDVDGLSAPTLENVARWVFERLDARLPGLEGVTVRRGAAGHSEGTTYSGRPGRGQAAAESPGAAA